MMPLMAHNVLQSIQILSNGSRVFALRCVAGIEADSEKCQAMLEQSLALATALVPGIGYDKAAEVAKRAFETNRTVREVAQELIAADRTTLDQLLDPANQISPR